MPGWTKPANRDFTADPASPNVFTGEYKRIINFGPLQVNLDPPSVVIAGAQWQLDGGAWNDSDATLPEVSAGVHVIQFKAVNGWTTPLQNANVVVNAGQPIANNYGVPMVLAEAVKAEGSIERVTRLFDVSASAVRDAVKFEKSLAA